FGRGETVYDPWHYVPVLARKPGALRNGAPFKDWVLPAAMERVRRKLASADDGNRQMVDILAAVLTDGLPAVEAACAEAVIHGVHSADVVLNILSRQRDPGPPATILTPAALTLRHAPVADCARYDNLSDCLVCQAGCHFFLSLSMALRMVRSLRATAIRATIFGLPAARRR